MKSVVLIKCFDLVSYHNKWHCEYCYVLLCFQLLHVINTSMIPCAVQAGGVLNFNYPRMHLCCAVLCTVADTDLLYLRGVASHRKLVLRLWRLKQVQAQPHCPWHMLVRALHFLCVVLWREKLTSLSVHMCAPTSQRQSTSPPPC